MPVQTHKAESMTGIQAEQTVYAEGSRVQSKLMFPSSPGCWTSLWYCASIPFWPSFWDLLYLMLKMFTAKNNKKSYEVAQKVPPLHKWRLLNLGMCVQSEFHRVSSLHIHSHQRWWHKVLDCNRGFAWSWTSCTACFSGLSNLLCMCTKVALLFLSFLVFLSSLAPILWGYKLATLMQKKRSMQIFNKKCSENPLMNQVKK